MVNKEEQLKGIKNRDLPTKFPIVGIGASAGGLEALNKFFSVLPPDTGMAFVLVQHLDPTHKSTLVDLLRRHAQINVVQVKDGLKVEPDKLYVIPPNRDMGILNGELQLIEPLEPHGLRLPINFFLKNLADDQKENSIAIILSGFGSDGSTGLRAIKAEGGMVMAQDPDTADSQSMPQSAINTKLVDFILPPEKMPKQLMSYVDSSRITLKKILTPEEETRQAIKKILMLIRNRTGHDFSLYKENTVYRRIGRRMNIHQIEKTSNYLRYLQENHHEIEILFKELLINVTSFFRDSAAFYALKNVIRELITEKSDYTLRVWVPGCSTGEEVYSIAIIIHEIMEESGKNLEVQIFGTDIDKDAIKTARSGSYPRTISPDVSKERLKKYFIEKTNEYVIKNDIREMVVFAPHDVLKDPPFTKLDILSCRNLLIYLKTEAQRIALSNFNYALNGAGILFLGPSESVGGFIDAFTSVDKKWRIYKCIKSTEFVRRFVELHPLNLPMSEGNSEFKVKAAKDKSMGINIVNLAEKELLDVYAPPSAIITDSGEILFIHGRLGNYLEPAPGKAQMNIMEMAREGLKFELNSAIQNAISKKTVVLLEGLRVKSNGDYSFVNITVKPLNEPEALRGLLIISFEKVKPKEVKEEDKIKLDLVSDGDNRIMVLENELKATKERLNITIEEMKTSNEELRSANEELQSMNEEAQSTNEELETSKEELQSINEELSTVNAELQMKVEELIHTKDDMYNLFNSTEIASIFLDNNLNIRRFTKEATRLINMRDSDLGRPLSDIVSNLKYEKLVDDIREVIQRVAFKEKELQTVNGEWYQMRIMPYKTSEDVIDGAVITFNNITPNKNIQQKIQAALDYADNIIDTVREPLLILNNELQIVSANRSFYQTFKVTPEETEGHELFKLGNGQWDIPILHDLLENILTKNNELDDFLVEHKFPQIGTKKILLNARRIYSENPSTPLILLAIEISKENQIQS
jgi:two-component system, chemotaxis family, CheB/CheR fusion protein